jgi:hypothetical protein
VAVDINSEDRVSGGGSVRNTATGERQSGTFGAGVLPPISFAYSYGTGNAQVTKWVLQKRTLAATTFDNLDLTAGLSTLGVVQAFTAIKRVFVGIVDPDGTKKLRIGPQNQTHANQLWFQAVTANFWEETYTHILKDRPVTGWAVAAGSTDVLSIYNPGASSLDYALWLMGN